MWDQCLISSVKMQRHEITIQRQGVLSGFAHNEERSKSIEGEVTSVALSREIGS